MRPKSKWVQCRPARRRCSCWRTLRRRSGRGPLVGKVFQKTPASKCSALPLDNHYEPAGFTPMDLYNYRLHISFCPDLLLVDFGTIASLPRQSRDPECAIGKHELSFINNPTYLSAPPPPGAFLQAKLPTSNTWCIRLHMDIHHRVTTPLLKRRKGRRG